MVMWLRADDTNGDQARNGNEKCHRTEHVPLITSTGLASF